jgi:hypothetical protein
MSLPRGQPSRDVPRTGQCSHNAPIWHQATRGNSWIIPEARGHREHHAFSNGDVIASRGSTPVAPPTSSAAEDHGDTSRYEHRLRVTAHVPAPNRPEALVAARGACADLTEILSQSVHPSVSTSNTYIEPESGALRLTPRLGYPASVQMIAHWLIWAQRDLDKVLPDPARAQGLEKLASAIGAVPVLPGYQPPTPPAPRGRGGSRTSGAGQPAPPGGS